MTRGGRRSRRRVAVAVGFAVVASGLSGCAFLEQRAVSQRPGIQVVPQRPVAAKSASFAPPTSASASVAAPHAAGDVSVTPDEARTFVTSFWPRYADAFTPVNPQALAALDEGSAKVADQNAVCGCEPPSPSIASVEVSVPRQTSYPAVFMAEVATGGDASTLYMLEFRRDSAAFSWRLASRVTLWDPTSRGFGVPALDDEGYAQPIDPADSARSAAFLTDLANAWQHAKESGDARTPPEFRSVDWLTGDRLAELAASRQDSLVLSAGSNDQDMYGHFEFALDPATPLYEVPVADRATLVCGAITETTVWTPRPGQVITETDREPFYALAPGKYSKVVDTTPWQVCFYVAWDSTQAATFGIDGRNFGSSVGTPASRS